MSNSHTARGKVRYRWLIASRVLAASVGAYILTSLIASVLALLLPLVLNLSRAEAVLIVTLLSFAIYTALAIWTFSISSVSRVWCCLCVWSGLLSVLMWCIA